jgi:CrcB protein
VTPPPITLRRAALVAGGGMAGAACRWATSEAIGPDRLDGLPWALLVVNVVGSMVLAAAVVASRRRPDRASFLVDGIGTGFCGGLTTFSAFAVTTAEQLRAGEAIWAAASVLTMVVAGVAAAACAESWLSRGDVAAELDAA